MGKPSTVALKCLTKTMWAPRCRPGMSPGKESPSSFSQRIILGDMSPGIAIPSDKSCRSGIPEFIPEDSGSFLKLNHNPFVFLQPHGGGLSAVVVVGCGCGLAVGGDGDWFGGDV
ncbi:hypothetical protein Tco_1096581 [Tanacetum coccineum]